MKSNLVLIRFTFILLLFTASSPLVSQESEQWIQPAKSDSMLVAPSRYGLATLEQVLVELDVDALKALEATPKSVLDRSLRSDPKFTELDIYLPRLISATLHIDSTSQIIDGVTTFVGTLGGFSRQEGNAVLSLEGEEVTGQFVIGDTLFSIYPNGSISGHVVEVVDRTALPRYPEAELAALERSSSKRVGGSVDPVPDSGSSSGLGSGNATVRVTMLYTPDVASANNINSLVSNIIAGMNTSLEDSAVDFNVYFELAGMHQTSSNYSNDCRFDIWEDMNDETNGFQNLASTMASDDADIATLIVTTELGYSHCSSGLGRVGGIANILDSSDPWGLYTDTYALGDFTAHHETGHIVGGNHTYEAQQYWGYGNASGTPSNARGHVASDEDFQTIMGGYQAPDCDFNFLSSSCNRIPQWSTPFRTYSGESTGIYNQSYMAEALETTMPTVAAWESFPGSSPGVPSYITVFDYDCFGQNHVSWASVSNTTTYQLFRSTSPSFTNLVRVYNGSNNYSPINVGAGETWYLKVRACNGDGCGGLSSLESADYENSCI